MQKYGSKGLAIFQINNDGASQGSTPTTLQLMAWVDYYKAAGASGIDPKRRSSKFYYDGGASVSIPYNFILDAKTRKVLEKKVSAANVEARIQYHLNK
jgi:hypothetical protein